MEQKDFHVILKKYLQGEATAEEKQLIDSWYQELGKENSPLSDIEEAELENHYWTNVSAHVKSSRKSRTVRLWYSSGIAASVLIAITIGFYLAGFHRTAKQTFTEERQTVPSTWSLVKNTEESTKVVALPDSSKVTLKPKSEIKFLSAFNELSREVYLEGEAFFEVFHDAERPFLVYANEVTTKVLGTSFTVKAFDQEKKITVSVRTGKVSVSTNSKSKKGRIKPDEIILTPNQQIVYDPGEDKMFQTIVSEPQAIIPVEEFKRMRFEEAPVSKIFEAIEKVYGVDIEYDEDKFSSCFLTTTISDGGIYNRLDIICNAIGANYSLSGSKIVINGVGCN